MIALVDDDSLMRRWLTRVLEKGGHQVQSFATGQALLEGMDPEVDVVCLDLGLEGMGGMEILKILREKAPDRSVIVVTAETRTEIIVEAMRGGAYDYLVEPLEAERVLQSVGRAAERQGLLREVQRLRREKSPLVSLVGDSEAMREIRGQIEQLAESDMTVCLQGERPARGRKWRRAASTRRASGGEGRSSRSTAPLSRRRWKRPSFLAMRRALLPVLPGQRRVASSRPRGGRFSLMRWGTWRPPRRRRCCGPCSSAR